MVLASPKCWVFLLQLSCTFTNSLPSQCWASASVHDSFNSQRDCTFPSGLLASHSACQASAGFHDLSCLQTYYYLGWLLQYQVWLPALEHSFSVLLGNTSQKMSLNNAGISSGQPTSSIPAKQRFPLSSSGVLLTTGDCSAPAKKNHRIFHSK